MPERSEESPDAFGDYLVVEMRANGTTSLKNMLENGVLSWEMMIGFEFR
jgi:hypothetical protein